MSYPKPDDFTVPPPPDPTKHFGPTIKLRSDVIATLVKSRGWTRGVELGTGDGRNAERILVRCPELHLITVDLWAPQPENSGPEDWGAWDHEGNEIKARSRLRRFGGRATVVKGLTKDAAREVPDGIDFVFIDADHSEQGVRSDIRVWRPKVRAGGMVIGHDAGWPGVRAAIDDLCPGYWIGPNGTWGIDV